MKKTTAPEREWYGTDWRSLRRNLLNFCIAQAQEFLDEVRSDSADVDKVIEAFFERLLNRMSDLVVNDGVGLWRHALPLFEGRTRFISWIRRDLDALRGLRKKKDKFILPKQALGQILWQYFELARRELVATGRGVSVARIKTWERLDRISRKLAAEPPVTDQRCAEEHFLELSTYVKDNHPMDRNLPRKVSTIREYFLEFSDACIQFGVPETMQACSTDESELDFISPLQEQNIEAALQALDETARACLDIAFGTSLSSVSYIDKEAFLVSTGISEQDYRELLETTLERARPLLEMLATQGLEGADDE